MSKISNPQDVVSPTVSIAPAVIITTTKTGAAANLTGVDQALVLFNYGVITDGTFTPSLTSSDTLGGSYTADTGFSGVMTAGTDEADERIIAVAYNGTKNFLKAVLTVSGSPSTGGYATATIIPFKNGFRP